MALWDGRFSGGPGDDMVAFSQSLDTDMQMWAEDIEGSRAHVVMLAEVGLLEEEEAAELLRGLQQVAEELGDGRFVPTWKQEDIHMAVEARLTEIVGDVGAKLHTARSRNDQVATDVRLWLRARLDALDVALYDLLSALVDRVEADGDVLIPGFTHLQRGQPVLLGHHLLAHAWMVARDLDRVRDARRRMNRCPLGAGAMAGTPHPIDRHRTAELLGFEPQRLIESSCDSCFCPGAGNPESKTLCSASERAVVEEPLELAVPITWSCSSVDLGLTVRLLTSPRSPLSRCHCSTRARDLFAVSVVS